MTADLLCPGCGEPLTEIASRQDGVYYGLSHACTNGSCSFCHGDRVAAVTPVSLCDHESLKRVPGGRHQYCAACGQLEVHFDEGYSTSPAPWELEPGVPNHRHS